MGNYASCTLPTPLMKNSRPIRVYFPGGEIRRFRDPVKAADLMLELPSFFATDTRSLRVGRRFLAIPADEELESGGVYVMFPMRRVNSVVTAADLAVLFVAGKRISGGKVRVLPHSGAGDQRADQAEADHDHHDQSGINGGFDEIVPEFKYRLAACRSRKPMLETIKEEPVRLR